METAGPPRELLRREPPANCRGASRRKGYKNRMELKVKYIAREGVPEYPLERATPGSAGLDLHAAVNEPVRVEPGALVKIPSGVAVGIPAGHAGFVFARSGLGIKHGIALSNGVGVIDGDYTGEICVGLCNVSNEAYTVEPGERIAQLVVMPVAYPASVRAEELETTARAAGGFGSTGKF